MRFTTTMDIVHCVQITYSSTHTVYHKRDMLWTDSSQELSGRLGRRVPHWTDTLSKSSVRHGRRVPFWTDTLPESSVRHSRRVTADTLTESRAWCWYMYHPDLIRTQAHLLGYILCIPTRTVRGTVEYISLLQYQGCLPSHDFLVQRKSLLQYKSLMMLTRFLLHPNIHHSETQSVSFNKDNSVRGGGRRKNSDTSWTFADIVPYLTETTPDVDSSTPVRFVRHISNSTVPLKDSEICTDVPLSLLSSHLSNEHLQVICQLHKIDGVTSRSKVSTNRTALSTHSCTTCKQFQSIFVPIVSQNPKSDQVRKAESRERKHQITSLFPPEPPSRQLLHTVLTDYCNDIQSDALLEGTCAVCALLTPVSRLAPLTKHSSLLGVLTSEQAELTRQERTSSEHPIEQLEGPVILPDCNTICNTCLEKLKKGMMPKNALANGLWIGEVPQELQDLTWTEKMLIARVKHNFCVIQVKSSQMHKMKANAISHSIPMPKVYQSLPPAREELDEVLAFLYIGPNKPTEKEFKRTPFLVRRNKVAKALEWLKLNHIDYQDLTIAYDKLEEYPEDMPPVVVDYHQSTNATKEAESTAVNDTAEDDGTSEGQCPFTVFGLTGDTLVAKMKENPQEIRAKAIQHFVNGKVLGIGQNNTPESLYHNPQLYPQMFPWLFPYGFGGLDNTNGVIHVSEEARKRQLLMYHDKRFQLEPLFPLIALNHEQIKDSVTGGLRLLRYEVIVSMEVTPCQIVEWIYLSLLPWEHLDLMMITI